MSELTDFAPVILLVAGAFAVAILATPVGRLVPVPAPALFLVASAIASDIWPALRDDISVRTVERIAVVALIVILLNGGIDIGWRQFRAAAGPIVALGIAGTFITAAVLASVSTGGCPGSSARRWRPPIPQWCSRSSAAATSKGDRDRRSRVRPG